MLILSSVQKSWEPEPLDMQKLQERFRRIRIEATDPIESTAPPESQE